MVSPLIDRVLHPSLRQGSHDEMRAARLTAAIPVVLVGTCIASVPALLVQGDVAGVGSLVITASAYGTALAILRGLGRRELAAHVVLLAFTVTLLGFLLRADGVRGASAYWLTILPLLGTLLLGRRGGAIWLGVTVVLALGFVVAAWLGVDVPPTEVQASTGASAAGLLVHVVTFFGIVWSFDVTRSQMAHAVEIERANAERARARADAAHRAGRRVLDAVDQALFTVRPGGSVDLDAMSAAAVRWFGEPSRGERLWDWLSRTDAKGASWLEVAWGEHEEGVLPSEVTLEQLPRTLEGPHRTFALRWLPIEGVRDVLVVATDVTEAMAAERRSQRQQDVVSLLGRSLRDGDAVAAFLTESGLLVERILTPTAELAPLLRDLHTLKGNAAVFELPGLSRLCHEIEGDVLARDALDESDREQLHGVWVELRSQIAPFLLPDEGGTVRVARTEVSEVLSSLLQNAPHREVARSVERWLLEPTRPRLERAGEHARTVAVRLGRREPEVHVEDGGVEVPPERWGPVWAAFGHAVRNAVDHGIEPEERRVAVGKPAYGRLWLTTSLEGGEVVVRVRDDGGGIDWSAVAAKAEARGLPHSSRDELVEALFADGLSTREVATDVSGRGVGMAALRAAVTDLGGRVEVVSRPGQGTTLELHVPQQIAA